MGLAGSPGQDWSAFYSKARITQWQLPASSGIDEGNGIFRGLFQSINQITAGKADAPLWFFCADVLDLTGDVVLDRPAYIYARRIQVAGSASLILDRTGDGASLRLYAQEVVDRTTGAVTKLNISALASNNQSSVHTFVPDPQNLGASGLFWDDDNAPVSVTPQNIEPELLHNGEPLRLSLMTEFQLATLLSTEQVAISMSQLRWVASMAQASTETLDLALQAGQFGSTLLGSKAAGLNAFLVPVLDLSVYAESAKAFSELLTYRDNAWQSLQAMAANDRNWLSAAASSLADAQNQASLAQKLEAQAESSRQQALAARVAATEQVISAKQELAKRESDFQAGVEIWKRAQTISTAFELVTGIVEVLASIPTIVAAGPEAAESLPQLAQSGIGIINAAARGLAAATAGSAGNEADDDNDDDAQDPAPNQIWQNNPLYSLDDLSSAAVAARQEGAQEADAIAKETTKDRLEAVGKLAEGLKTAGKGAQTIVDSAMKINEIAKAAEEMEATSNAMLNTIGQTVDKAFESFELQGLDVVTGGSQEWDTLAASIEDQFTNLGGSFGDILSTIDGGSAYRVQFRVLVICGQALCQARLAVVTANGQVAEMVARRLSAENAVAIAQQRVKQLTSKVTRDDTLAQLAFNRVLDAKRAVYLAMDAYIRAFRYFTLASDNALPALPRLTDSTDDFIKAVAAISTRQLVDSALSKPPSTLGAVTLILDDKVMMEEFRKTGVATWPVSTSDTKFTDFGRVRIDEIRVFAVGLAVDDTVDVEVRIDSSGTYNDKPLDGTSQAKRFVCQPTQRNMVYHAAQRVTAHADIAPRFKDDFFQPTPFTTWRFQVLRQDRKDLDLSSVTALKVVFTGVKTDFIEQRASKAAG